MGEIEVEAAFACAVCGEEAGRVVLRRFGVAAEIRRESWPGVRYATVSDGALPALRAALADRDVPRLFALDFELTPFYCPDCGASYCSAHWDWWDVWDDELPGWRDSVRGRCPLGHERMLED